MTKYTSGAVALLFLLSLGLAKIYLWPKPIAPGASAGQRPFSYAPFEHVLRTSVDTSGQVDYRRLQNAPDSLNAFLALLARYSPETTPASFPTRAAQLAYWINAYNAFVLKGVLEGYPVKSVRDLVPLRGFFWRWRFITGGRAINLHSLENRVIRKQFADPRIHFAINCASRGCPALAATVYMPATLDAQLDQAARRFINNPQHVEILPRSGRLRLSAIFDWYEDDFLNSLRQKSQPQPTLIDYLAAFLTPERRRLLFARKDWIVSFRPYDWSLNDAVRPGALSQAEFDFGQ